jgi:Putative phage metallopeptidase
MKKIILYILLICQIVSCKTDIEVAPTLVYQVPQEVESYVDKFIEEAKMRGLEFKKQNLILEFSTTLPQDVCGQCSQVLENPTKYQRKIKIANNSRCWTSAKVQSRETLIFHELGHCLLGRIKHKDDYLPNGAPTSIMNSQNENPYSPCDYDISGNGDCDKTYRRKYYIDELFDEKTPVPIWGK